MGGNVKKFWCIFLILGIVLFTGGCGFIKNPGLSGQTGKQQETLAEYEVITDTAQLPLEVKSIVEILKSRQGYYVFTPQEYSTGEDSYLFISSGTKPSGGYTLNVDSATVQGNTLGVGVQEEEPAAEEGVIQIITFPYLVLKINSGYQSYRIVNDKNESFAEIPADAVPQITEKEGIYVGQIDNNFIEIETDGQPQAFMLEPGLDPLLFEDLQTGDKITFSYYKNDNGQLVIINLQAS